MKITIKKSLVLTSVCWLTAVCAYGDDRFGRPHDDDRQSDRYQGTSYERRREVVPVYQATEARMRIKAPSRRDHALAHDYINALAANRALSPGGPPINVSIRNGQVHLHGNVGSSEEHRALVRIAESLPGVRNVQDELKGG